MLPAMPDSLRVEHEQLRADLEQAIRIGGRIGYRHAEVAQAVVVGAVFNTSPVASWRMLEARYAGFDGLKATLEPFIANYMEEAGRFFKEPEVLENICVK